MTSLNIAFIVALQTGTLTAFAEDKNDVHERLKQAEAGLNQTYQLLLKQRAADSEFITNLREAERGWIKYVEFHLKNLSSVKEGHLAEKLYGPTYPVDATEVEIQYTVARIKELCAFGVPEPFDVNKRTVESAQTSAPISPTQPNESRQEPKPTVKLNLKTSLPGGPAPEVISEALRWAVANDTSWMGFLKGRGSKLKKHIVLV